MSLFIHSLYIYPVKSLGGISLQQAELSSAGLAWDRRWMLIFADGSFASQRKLPAMALIQAALDEAQGFLRLSHSEHGELKIPLNFRSDKNTRTAKIWRDEVEVWDEGDHAAHWLTQACKASLPLRLVRLGDTPRPQSKPELLGVRTSTHFADAAPLLIANQASLSALNMQLQTQGEQTVAMDRFRPNVVVEGLAPWQEHQVASLSSTDHNIVLKLCYPCQRCVMTTIDQQSAQKHPRQQPFMSLRKLNPMPLDFTEGKLAPAFAENAVVERGVGLSLQCGQTLLAADKKNQ